MSEMSIKELQEEVKKLKREKKATILSHYYQRREIQEIGDFLGDSLELCRKALEVKDSDIIVFNGVDFMAETAAIVNPTRVVLHPIQSATCPMAHMLKAEEVREYKKKYPHATVVLYVNTLAEAKAEADVVCTSANAAKIISAIDSDEILFGPDKNLAAYVQKHNPSKKIIPMPKDGFCYVHKLFTSDDVLHWRKEIPHAKILVHPECIIEVQDLSDAVLSTSQMVKYIKESDAHEFVIGTEIGLISYLERVDPSKKYYPLLIDAICSTMKKIFLKDVIDALKYTQYVVTVDKDIAEKSKRAIDKMFELMR